ncbi:hypothetical protein MAR_001944 [Mya arenaria]|uniref:HECT domain-containing protein n=1 Tax=Mya arenaria TaxID=6604 RepID=A0ABY7FH84_MYAAR|nr:hypothetical protein MAR_001944 [Mya arenaria]
MSNQLRASELLRQAANLLVSENSSTTCSESQSTPSVTTATSIGSTTSNRNHSAELRAATRALFAPYNRGTRRRGNATGPPDTVPSREEKALLFQAGVGEKKLTIIKTYNADLFKQKLEEAFPPIINCGGFELLRTCGNSKYTLQPLPIPPGGYTTKYLCDESSLGQAVCYIRPIQKDLDINLCSSQVDTDDQTTEMCLRCGKSIPLQRLRLHIDACGTDEVPHYTELCPICHDEFPVSTIEEHAASCCENQLSNPTLARTRDAVLDAIAAKVGDSNENWLINVVRRNFFKTTFEELSDALTIDWEKPIKIPFIGEEGLDAGGLTREFFSLLFRNNDLFENGSFRLDSGLLEKKTYETMGRATARAILAGHPGPKCFNPLLARFICTGEEPDLADIPDEYVGRPDVLAAIQEISTDSTGSGDLVQRHGDLLEQAGFRKVLSSSTTSLKLLGVQTAIQGHAEESIKFFTTSPVSASDVQSFFKPTYTPDSELKPREEMIMYNFGKFLKKAERGTLSTPWIDIYDGVKTQVVINTGHVLQALIGCETLPRNIECGLVEFSHTSNNLTTVNTCAPSIMFSQTARIQEYETFEKHFLSLIVDAVGFGIA